MYNFRRPPIVIWYSNLKHYGIWPSLCCHWWHCLFSHSLNDTQKGPIESVNRIMTIERIGPLFLRPIERNQAILKVATFLSAHTHSTVMSFKLDSSSHLDDVRRDIAASQIITAGGILFDPLISPQNPYRARSNRPTTSNREAGNSKRDHDWCSSTRRSCAPSSSIDLRRAMRLPIISSAYCSSLGAM